MKAAEKALHTEQRARGVTFRVGDEPERLFPLDLLPRIDHRRRLGRAHRGAHPACPRAGGVPARRLRRAADHRGRRRPRLGRRRRPGPYAPGQARAAGRGADRRGRHRPGARPAGPLDGARGQPARPVRHGLLDHEQAPDPERHARPGAADRRRRPGGRAAPAPVGAAVGRRPGPGGLRRGGAAVGRRGRLGVLRAQAAGRPHGRTGGDARATCRSPTTGCSSSSRAAAPGSRRSTGGSTSSS